MATITRILRGSFSTSVTASPPNERSLETLAEKFKTWSRSRLFRRKAFLYNRTVRRLASAKKYKLIEEILEHQKRYNEIYKEGFAIRLISLYGKSGMFDHACKVFDEMPKRNCPQTVLSFNALLDACVEAKEFDKFDGLFRDLPGKISVKPDIVSYNTMIKAFCKKGSLDSAVSVFDEIQNNGLSPNLITYNTLLIRFYANGRFLDGEKYWAKMMNNTSISPDLRSYNAKLVGLVSEKKMPEAIELFNQLYRKKRKAKADVYSYNAIINGFCNDANLQEAKKWYSKLVQSDSAPNSATFKALIELACKMDDFDWAVELFKQTFERRRMVAPSIMQLVIDGLVKDSKTEEAKQLVEIANSYKFETYHLTMPAEETNA